jgi:hypothetical protein
MVCEGKNIRRDGKRRFVYLWICVFTNKITAREMWGGTEREVFVAKKMNWKNTFGTFWGGNGTENMARRFVTTTVNSSFNSSVLMYKFFIFSKKKKREAKLIYVLN